MRIEDDFLIITHS